jgi:hypothetical protein
VAFAYPPAPPPAEPPSQPPADAYVEAPSALRRVLVLLLINLALSVVLTIAVLIKRNEVVDYQLDHRHVVDAAQRSLLRHTYLVSLWTRVLGNVVVSIVYAFLVRALLRGRRWAYRRVIIIGIAGIVALVLVQLSPYPAWMRVEQIVQAVVLALLLYFVLRPEVRAHFAKGLPGRDVRRFRKQ